MHQYAPISRMLIYLLLEAEVKEANPPHEVEHLAINQCPMQQMEISLQR